MKNTPEFIDSTLMGRAAAKFEGLDETLRNLASSMVEMHDGLRGYAVSRDDRPTVHEDQWMKCGSLLHSVDSKEVIAAKPIVASRLSFPAAPSFDPIKFFDAPTAEVYLRPIDNAVDYEIFDREVPMVKVNAVTAERLALFRKLADTGRLKPVTSNQKRGRLGKMSPRTGSYWTPGHRTCLNHQKASGVPLWRQVVAFLMWYFGRDILSSLRDWT